MTNRRFPPPWKIERLPEIIINTESRNFVKAEIYR